jgi:hypothetical protein
MGSIGVGFQLPWRAKANAERSAAQARLELDNFATNPTMVIAEQSDGDQGIQSLHKLAKVNRFVLPFLLESDPSREENGVLQRLTTIDVEPVTFQNKDIAGLVNAINIARTSTSEQKFDSDFASINRALEKALRDGNNVVFY